MEKMGQKKNVLKVIELGLQDRVYNEMKKDGFSAEALTRDLNSEGIEITAQSIRKFIKKTKKAQQELIKKDVNRASEVAKITMDYENELKSILNEVKEVKNDAKGKKDYMVYDRLIGRLLQGIELIAKLTGDMGPLGKVDIKFIYNEINSDIESKMKHLKNDVHNATVIDIDEEVKEEDKKLSGEMNE
jgi:hypothetical protein